jgi:hypothetical protein
MNDPPTASCEEFDDGVDQLAVGALVEPERSALLAHAASCPACEARLNGLAGVADRLLLLAPEVEPPVGFEAGVLARLADGTPASDPATAPGRRWQPGRRVAAVAAVAAVALVVSGIALGRATQHGPAAVEASSGGIFTPAGVGIGTAGVYRRPLPYVLLSFYAPPRGGPMSCELETAQGRRMVVGWWDYQGINGGVWAAGIDRSLAGAVTMRIVDQHGTIVATAALTKAGRDTRG